MASVPEWPTGEFQWGHFPDRRELYCGDCGAVVWSAPYSVGTLLDVVLTAYEYATVHYQAHIAVVTSWAKAHGIRPDRARRRRPPY